MAVKKEKEKTTESEEHRSRLNEKRILHKNKDKEGKRKERRKQRKKGYEKTEI